MFSRLSDSFAIFEQVFCEEHPVPVINITDSLLKGEEGDYLCYDDLPRHAKAEALIPILVASCLDLASSSHQSVVQDIFGRLAFHARSSLCGFHVTRKGSPSVLTIEATSYLHGRSLTSLMGAPEEAFIRFVIITDFFRYHFEAVGELSVKYRHLLDNGVTNVAHLQETYVGVKAVK